MEIEVYSQPIFDEGKKLVISRINKYAKQRQPDKNFTLDWIAFNGKNWYACAFKTKDSSYFADFKSSALSSILIDNDKEIYNDDEMETLVQIIEHDFGEQHE